jgi:hypothetical protein|nr:MAG TPA: hypothetical protein [Caudoviricetes sp.]
MSDFKLTIRAVYEIVLHVFALNGILAWLDYIGW